MQLRRTSMKAMSLIAVGLWCLAAAAPLMAQEKPKLSSEARAVLDGTSKSRTFLFTYSATVKNLDPGTEASIWLPVPSDSAEQTVTIAHKKLPAQEQMGKDKEYGNRILFVKAKADKDGRVNVEVTYKVTRKEGVTKGDPDAFFKPL